MFSAADFRFFAKICRNLYKHFAKSLQRMFFGSHLESIICKTNYVRVRVRRARRPCAWFPIPIPLLS